MLGQVLKVICDCLAARQCKSVGVCSDSELERRGFGQDQPD